MAEDKKQLSHRDILNYALGIDAKLMKDSGGTPINVKLPGDKDIPTELTRPVDTNVNNQRVLDRIAGKASDDKTAKKAKGKDVSADASKAATWQPGN